MENNTEKGNLKIEDLYSHPQLRYTGILPIGKYISILLILVSVVYLKALNPSMLYNTVLGLSYLLHFTFFATLLCFARYVGNFELKGVQRWLYSIAAIIGLTIIMLLTGIIKYVSGTFAQINHMGISNVSIVEVVLAIFLFLFILGIFFTGVVAFIISGIKLIKFKGDFIGGLKQMGIMLLVYPAVIIIIYLLSMSIDVYSDYYPDYLRFIIISISCTLAATGIFSFMVFTRATSYLRNQRNGNNLSESNDK